MTGWRTSSYSDSGSQCVEVAHRADAWLVRDTKDRDGGALAVPAVAWKAFLDGIR
nr:DUF397 domain-containing protein [Amycolatopsis arida]